MFCCGGRDNHWEALGLALQCTAMNDVLMKLQDNLEEKPKERRRKQGKTKCRCEHPADKHGKQGCRERVNDAAGDMDWCPCEFVPKELFPEQIEMFPLTTKQRKEFSDMAYALRIIARKDEKGSDTLHDERFWRNKLLRYEMMMLIGGSFKKPELLKAADLLDKIGNGVPLPDYMDAIKFLGRMTDIGLWKCNEPRGCF